MSKDEEREYENFAYDSPGFRTMIRNRIPPLVGLQGGTASMVFLQGGTASLVFLQLPTNSGFIAGQ